VKVGFWACAAPAKAELNKTAARTDLKTDMEEPSGN
jgi:hypothetical protein